MVEAELPIPITVDWDAPLSEDDDPEPFPLNRAIAANGPLLDGRYELGEEIAEGGMGVVRTGRHVMLDQRVAIKFIRPELIGNEEAIARFLNEARVAASLRGEHIARVMDVGRLDSGVPYLVMERLEGADLASVLKQRGRLDVDEVVNVALQVASGLAEAHASRLVHRDIKPENLFLSESANGVQTVKILDFGVSKRLGPLGATLTDPNQSIGSPLYMSPEQMKSPSDVDSRTDVWSLGVTMYQLLCGELPFDGETTPQICAKVLAHEPRPVRALRPDAPVEFEAIIACCLEKDRGRRYESVEQLAADLERVRARLKRAPRTRMVSTDETLHRVDSAFDSTELDAQTRIPGVRSRAPWLVATFVVALVGGGVALAEHQGLVDIRGSVRSLLPASH